MNQEEIMGLVYDYCVWKKPQALKALCEQYPDKINLTDKEGEAFVLALAYESVDVLNVLLAFYEHTKLLIYPTNSTEYQDSYHILQDLLENARDQSGCSEEIKLILDKYITEISNNPKPDVVLDEDYVSEFDRVQDDRVLMEDITESEIIASLAGEEGVIYGNMTAGSLDRNYQYSRIAREAEADYKNESYKDCIDKITRAASSIFANKQYAEANKALKGSILYKYLCFYNDNKIGDNVVLGDPWKFVDIKTYGLLILQNAICDNNYSMVESLLGREPELASITDEYGQTALHWAASDAETTRLLLSAMTPADIKKQAEGNHGYTALHLAIHSKNNEIVELLLATSPELASITDEYGQTALHWAVGRINVKNIKELISIMPLDALGQKSNNGYTALDLLQNECSDDIIDLLKARTRATSDELITSDEDSTINTKERDSGSSAHTIDDLTKQLELVSLGANYVVSNDDVELSGAGVVIGLDVS